MGQKINPIAFRLGTLFTWSSRWFAHKKKYKDILLEDIKLRRNLMKRLKNTGIAKVEIERSINKIDITLHVARPGMVIGRGGKGLEDLKKDINTFFSNKKKKQPFKIDLKVEPIKEPNLNAHLVASNIADQLARRFPYKRAVRQAMDKVMNAGAKGVKVVLSGRIAGAEISRREKYQVGKVPLSTIRADIDYGAVPSLTKSGYIGVKVWICRS